MKKLLEKDFAAIQRQMNNRSRDIDLAVFNALFIDNDKDLVADAISMYLNTDGGFGHGLENDNLNPYSTAVQTNEALRILKLVGFQSINDSEHLNYLLKNSFKYLYDKAVRIANKWLLAESSNNKFPCAQKYKCEKEELNKNNPTASIVGLTLYFCDEKMKYYKKAMELLNKVIDDFLSYDIVDEYDIESYNVLVDCLELKNLTHPKLDELKEKLYLKSVELVNLNNSLALKLFNGYTEDESINKIIDECLDNLIDSLPTHGLWENTNKWENSYPEEESANLKWMGCITYRNLVILRNFNRL